MHVQGYSRIPRELCDWITFLVKKLPLRSVATFIELLIGSMLTPSGFVTDAYFILIMRNHWTSYYKWLRVGRWSWLGLARQFLCLLLEQVIDEHLYLVIDDTVTLRSSKKAPGSVIHHQHGNKPNLAQYVRGQCWVSLAVIARRVCGESVAIPVLSRLIPAAGNTGKLVAGKVLIRAIQSLLKGHSVRVLVDTWYMRRIFIESMVDKGFHVIGQVRIDTRLYDEPKPKQMKGRGRPRKYGDQVTKKRSAHFKRSITKLKLYGKQQQVRYRTRLVKARFLQGQLVRVVWCELAKESGGWAAARLLLSTDTKMSAEMIIEDYGRRWSIESWGLKEAWQQARQCLHRWVHITSIGYGLLQLLSCSTSGSVKVLCTHSPWRKENPQTPGQIRKGLQIILRHVDVRSWWNPTYQKFGPPI